MSYKVLIVEDDPMVAMINEQYVCKNKDFSVVASFRNGQDALAYLEKNQVDLIILDVFMPYMNGIETLKKIRDKKIKSEVIMVTAANDTATLEETMHLGVIDYLIKPFAYERLQVALEKFSSKVKTLKQALVLDQSCIDSILSNNSKACAKEYPKGIQEKTLNLILEYFDQNPAWQSGDMIAEKLGISIVTVRHYMSYLLEQKKILEDINYETGGRPCMLYKKKDL
ncbi:MAG: response regulator [Treponemataceae bacterium]|nr:response regulator [Treponemataceae bacterium]